MHSIIVSCLAEEPLFTAEQVSFKQTSSLTCRPLAEQLWTEIPSVAPREINDLMFFIAASLMHLLVFR